MIKAASRSCCKVRLRTCFSAINKPLLHFNNLSGSRNLSAQDKSLNCLASKIIEESKANQTKNDHSFDNAEQNKQNKQSKQNDIDTDSGIDVDLFETSLQKIDIDDTEQINEVKNNKQANIKKTLIDSKDPVNHHKQKKMKDINNEKENPANEIKKSIDDSTTLSNKDNKKKDSKSEEQIIVRGEPLEDYTRNCAYFVKMINCLKRLLLIREINNRNEQENIGLESDSDINYENQLTGLNPKKHTIYRDSYSKIPVLSSNPEHLNTDVFENYVYLLTYKNYHYKSVIESNGIITEILNDLFKPNDPLYTKLRTIDSYNDAIYFFFKVKRWQAINRLYKQLIMENLAPNTKTINLLLLSLSQFSTELDKKMAYFRLNKILSRMEDFNIRPDITTFSTIYKILPTKYWRVLYLRYITNKFNVKVNSKFFRIIMKDYCEKNLITREFFEYLVLNKNLCDEATIRLILETILDKNIKVDPNLKLNAAWVLFKKMIYQNEIYLNNEKNYLRAVLNCFLQHIATYERLDLCFEIYNTFTINLKVRPNSETFGHLIRGATKAGFYKNWIPVFRIIYKDMVGVIGSGNCPQADYWIKRAQSRALIDKTHGKPLDLTEPLSVKEIELRDKLRKELIWPKVGLYCLQNNKTNDNPFTSEWANWRNIRVCPIFGNKINNKNLVINTDQTQMQRRTHFNNLKHIDITQMIQDRMKIHKAGYESFVESQNILKK
ncbi:Aep3p ASCRUDRAFT_82990 [Ascoidea rubescens DSM 1968]|uniref:Uncharacterized protein n=1 Tax=Ascoidea rubescens DSM 1968 TaxID=1344418 RepID=A0A1D2V945_9ASCO|nr:hypothetical protein ASCRUDRAFT_82990 [Ascoidea rubescens DSM 1968]ODV58206.1 hypothetical protein ASCRUDRAFT_82990 [Ascoidea rubescens DSM 1968]